jgi:hypothetical protein
MASLPTRTTASFDAIKPVSSLVLLDNEFNQYVGASGVFNGGTTATKLLVKTSDATDPPVDQDQIGAGLLARWKQNGTTKVSISNTGLFTMVNTAVNTGFNADQVDGIEGASIAQIGSSKAYFALTFRIDDPSTFGLNDTSLLPVVRIPPIQSGFITRIHIVRYSGSHTAAGSVTFKANINSSSIGSGVAFNDTNNAAFTFYTEDFADQAISDGSAVTVVISARSGTISERSVSISVEGYQTIKA